MAIKLTAAEKDEIRRLTQFANRRIKAAHKAYVKEGKMVLPREVVGDIQLKQDWHTANTPLSRSVVFADRADYLDRLRFLQSFERRRPTITQYTENSKERTLNALETALSDVPDALRQKLNTMTAPQISDFWNKFSDKASRMGMAYSSQGAAQSALQEFFGEDYENLMK